MICGKYKIHYLFLVFLYERVLLKNLKMYQLTFSTSVENNSTDDVNVAIENSRACVQSSHVHRLHLTQLVLPRVVTQKLFRNLNPVKQEKVLSLTIVETVSQCNLFNDPGWQLWPNMAIMLWHGMSMVIHTCHGMIMARSWHCHYEM